MHALPANEISDEARSRIMGCFVVSQTYTFLELWINRANFKGIAVLGEKLLFELR
jgi:hypothetical protein